MKVANKVIAFANVTAACAVVVVAVATDFGHNIGIAVEHSVAAPCLMFASCTLTLGVLATNWVAWSRGVGRVVVTVIGVAVFINAVLIHFLVNPEMGSGTTTAASAARIHQFMFGLGLPLQVLVFAAMAAVGFVTARKLQTADMARTH